MTYVLCKVEYVAHRLVTVYIEVCDCEFLVWRSSDCLSPSAFLDEQLHISDIQVEVFSGVG
jgi:hypothetical protein